MISSGIYALVTFTLIVGLGQAENTDYDDDESLDEISQRVNNLHEEGAKYLEKVIRQIQDDRSHPPQLKEITNFPGHLYTVDPNELNYHENAYVNYVTPIYNISAPTPVPDVEAEIVPHAAGAAPPIELSKEELLQLYQAAIAQAAQLPLQQVGPTQIPQIQTVADVGNIPVKPAQQGIMNGPLSGYYYYYFPIKSFFTPTKKPEVVVVSKATPAPAVTTSRPQQLHATITLLQAPNKSTLEPLFMAISGFIGFALMFLLSILFSPKYHKIRSKNAVYKDSSDGFSTYAVLAIEAMAGKDCSERLACEMTRIFTGLKTNSKPLRVLEIILPQRLSYQISQIRKAAGKRANCDYIPCKRKKPPAPNQKPKKKETPHDLWMKHFENKKNVIPRPKPQQKQQQQNKYNYYHHQEQNFQRKNQKKPPPKKT